MDEREANVLTQGSAWRIGFFPGLVLLGIALPSGFLGCLDRYLYYLEPRELIPTYGTAWLLIACPSIMLGLVGGFVLQSLRNHARLAWLQSALIIALLGLAAFALVAAIAHATLLWLNQFGLLREVPVWRGLGSLSLIGAALLALTRRGGRTLAAAYGPARYSAMLGALSLLALPFAGWSNGTQAPPAPASRSGGARQKPNILLVTIDSLAASHMSLYGAARPTTPRLDAFARAATTFDHAYANANFTTAGISSILTATRPWSHRALQLPSWPNTPARQRSLPAVLDRGGYILGYFGANPFASPAKNGMGSYFSMDRGDLVPYFSFCNEHLSALLPYDCVAAELPQFTFAGRVWNKIYGWIATPPNWHFDPRDTLADALQWLAASDRRKPVFLWVHLFPPHAPYAAPAPWLGKFDPTRNARDAAHSEPPVAFEFGSVTPEEARTWEARYDESINYLDHFLGDFLDQATQRLGPDTVIILTADHGESFEHGYGTHTGPGLYESLIHIPLLIKLPFQTRGLRASPSAEQVDIGPTLAELAGLEAPPSWEGRSLAHLASTAQPASNTADAPVFAMNFEENHRDAALTTGSIAVVDEGWKLIHYSGLLRYPRMPALRDELFDLASDPGELNNQLAAQPQRAAQLRGLIDSQLGRHGVAGP